MWDLVWYRCFFGHFVGWCGIGKFWEICGIGVGKAYFGGKNPVCLCLYIKIINLSPILSVVGKFSSFPYCTGTSKGDICSLLLFIGDGGRGVSRELNYT